jgi:hypothetical protein
MSLNPIAFLMMENCAYLVLECHQELSQIIVEFGPLIKISTKQEKLLPKTATHLDYFLKLQSFNPLLT